MPVWLRTTLAVGVFGLLFWLESRRPLRHRKVEAKLTRNVRNLAVAALAAGTLQFVERPVATSFAEFVEAREYGLLKTVQLPQWLEIVVAVILLDYTLYWWHVLTHRIPILWRFHVAHHVDLDMDASTALRFHFGELAVSVPWRAAQVVVIGVSPLALSVWQGLLLISIMFHHSNVRLPLELERWLNFLVVTPRMHGIHHSTVPEESSSNWSSGLTVWDWLHGTLRLNVPQNEVVIGLPAYRQPMDVGLIEVLKMPFSTQRPSWQLPEGGTPSRPETVVSAERLLA